MAAQTRNDEHYDLGAGVDDMFELMALVNSVPHASDEASLLVERYDVGELSLGELKKALGALATRSAPMRDIAMALRT
jgi:hypothetical protein